MEGGIPSTQWLRFLQHTRRMLLYRYPPPDYSRRPSNSPDTIVYAHDTEYIIWYATDWVQNHDIETCPSRSRINHTVPLATLPAKAAEEAVRTYQAANRGLCPSAVALSAHLAAERELYSFLPNALRKSLFSGRFVPDIPLDREAFHPQNLPVPRIPGLNVFPSSVLPNSLLSGRFIPNIPLDREAFHPQNLPVPRIPGLNAFSPQYSERGLTDGDNATPFPDPLARAVGSESTFTRRPRQAYGRQISRSDHVGDLLVSQQSTNSQTSRLPNPPTIRAPDTTEDLPTRFTERRGSDIFQFGPHVITDTISGPGSSSPDLPMNDGDVALEQSQPTDGDGDIAAPQNTTEEHLNKAESSSSSSEGSNDIRTDGLTITPRLEFMEAWQQTLVDRTRGGPSKETVLESSSPTRTGMKRTSPERDDESRKRIKSEEAEVKGEGNVGEQVMELQKGIADVFSALDTLHGMFKKLKGSLKNS